MNKLASLRAHLLSLPGEIHIDPKQLIVLAQRGRVVSPSYERESNGFEWRYTAEIIITDFSGDPDKLAHWVLTWLDRHEPHRDDDAFEFEAEILNGHSTDLSLSVPLSDTVQAKETEAGVALQHYDEPMLDDSLESGLTQVFVEHADRVANMAPQGIRLSTSSVGINAVADDLVSPISVIDPDLNDAHTLELISQQTPGAFVIVGDQLRVGDPQLLGGLGTEHILTLRATDAGGLSVVDLVTLTVGTAVVVPEEPPAWTPEDILADLLWWGRSDNVVLASDLASQITDMSPRGLHATQSTSTRRPEPILVNDLPVLQFYGFDDVMLTESATWPTTQTIVGVLRDRGTSGYGYAASTYFATGWALVPGYGASANWTLFVGGSYISVPVRDPDKFATIVIELAPPGQTSKLTVNGVTATMTTPANYTSPAVPLVFAAYRSLPGILSAFGQLDFAEWAVVGRALTVDELANVNSYLSSEWGALP